MRKGVTVTHIYTTHRYLCQVRPQTNLSTTPRIIPYQNGNFAKMGSYFPCCRVKERCSRHHSLHWSNNYRLFSFPPVVSLLFRTHTMKYLVLISLVVLPLVCTAGEILGCGSSSSSKRTMMMRPHTTTEEGHIPTTATSSWLKKDSSPVMLDHHDSFNQVLSSPAPSAVLLSLRGGSVSGIVITLVKTTLKNPALLLCKWSKRKKEQRCVPHTHKSNAPFTSLSLHNSDCRQFVCAISQRQSAVFPICQCFSSNQYGSLLFLFVGRMATNAKGCTRVVIKNKKSVPVSTWML